MKKLCVTGSLHLDVIVNATHIPSSDETVPGTDVNYVFGGKGGNQALAADRYGTMNQLHCQCLHIIQLLDLMLRCI